MAGIDEPALDTLFRTARTRWNYTDEAVTDEDLRRLFELVELGPTSANCLPARFVFIRTAEGKEKLRPALTSGNLDKTMKAPVTVIVAYDPVFYNNLARLFPPADAKPWFAGNPELAEETAFRNGTLQGGYLIMVARYGRGTECKDLARGEEVLAVGRPVVFSPEMERPQPDEAETDAALVETLSGIAQTVLDDTGHAYRSVHAKGQGLLHGELRVLDGLPPALAQGLFAHAATYPAIMRLSTIPGDVLDDAISTPRGCALKVVGVPGARLAGSEADTSQDFVMVNAPSFAAATSKAFLGNLKLLAGTTDRLPGLKKVLSHAARATERVLEAFGAKSSLVITLGGQRPSHILGETFYSQAAILYGQHVAKVCLAPVSSELTALIGSKIDLGASANALREAVRAHFAAHGGEWELRVQLCMDLETMPIEDASIDWPQDRSPYLPVAVLSLPPQEAWSEVSVREIDDGMAFSPWHGIEPHRPLGNIMRARRKTYERSASFRGRNNGCPIHN